ncbi:DNA adenine methylase [Aliterella atlantica]|uniref:DNA adenine methylase n=1 Tax=Aliterella atlantica TaxID=1827278 RepID=UPI0005D3BB4A|nr:DNA adenine methylase [Aliterella atlantica]
MSKHIKSPLRYPGGKSKVINYLLPYIPTNISEFREPFVGGGSVFLAVKSVFQNRINKYWINDLNSDLYCFWKYVRDDLDSLVSHVTILKESYQNGKKLYNYLNQSDRIFSEFDRAVRFFIMNRITFSGIMDSGGYSQQAFEKRFTESSIERLKNLSAYLDTVCITCSDYDKLLHQDGEDVFLFLDPPYYQPTKSKLYGVKGNLHTSFDHERFAANVRKCQHRWLLTYDDCQEVRKLFDFAEIAELEVQYGMNNYKQKTAAKGKELLISNYSLKQLNQQVKQLSIDLVSRSEAENIFVEDSLC